MEFLVDECLSVRLVGVANEKEFVAYHVAHRGWSGLSDGEIAILALKHDLVLVTNNREDDLDLAARGDIHPGLIVIVPNVRRGEQMRLFRIVLCVC